MELQHCNNIGEFIALQQQWWSCCTILAWLSHSDSTIRNSCSTITINKSHNSLNSSPKLLTELIDAYCFRPKILLHHKDSNFVFVLQLFDKVVDIEISFRDVMKNKLASLLDSNSSPISNTYMVEHGEKVFMVEMTISKVSH